VAKAVLVVAHVDSCDCCCPSETRRYWRHCSVAGGADVVEEVMLRTC
jgi:hypothetical protein